MIVSPEIWFKWAKLLMPKNQALWLRGMEAEYEEISNPKERNRFAFGCFQSALVEFSRSRKGLNYIARTFGAACIIAFSCACLYAATNMAQETENLAIAKLISYLGLFYICGAALLLTTLRGFKIYASLGLGTALMGACYINIIQPEFKDLPIEFLTAINIEVAALMVGFLFAAIYLSWLYTPDMNDA